MVPLRGPFGETCSFGCLVLSHLCSIDRQPFRTEKVGVGEAKRGKTSGNPAPIRGRFPECAGSVSRAAAKEFHDGTTRTTGAAATFH